MDKISLAIAIFAISLVSCVRTHTKTWVVHSGDVKVIGYQIGDEQNAQDIIGKKLYSIGQLSCASGRWEYKNDTLQQKDYVGSYTLPTTNTTNHSGTVNTWGSSPTSYSGTSTTTNYQTHVYTGTNYWRETELHCLPSLAEERKGLQVECDANNIQSCYLLGSNYKLDDNSEKAKQFWETSCASGFKTGCARLLYQDGKIEEASKMNLDACKNEEAIGCNNYAHSILEASMASIPEGRDWAQAAAIDRVREYVKYIQKACNLGWEMSCEAWENVNAKLIKRENLAH